jgi:hypothetical protein
MLSTIKSVKDYTNVDLYQYYNSTTKRIEITNKILDLDPLANVSPSDVDADFESRQHLKRAQAIVEAYIGRDEIDIQNPSDLLLLDKIVSYQAAYMVENEDAVFNQIALTTQGQTDFIVNFDVSKDSPWIAPLVVISCRGLSFRKPRSIQTGKMFQFPKITKWRNV